MSWGWVGVLTIQWHVNDTYIIDISPSQDVVWNYERKIFEEAWEVYGNKMVQIDQIQDEIDQI